MLNWSLQSGSPLSVAIQAAGLLALVALCARRRRTWWLRALPVAAVIAALTTFGTYTYVTWVWQPLPEALPPLVWQAVFAAVLALVVAAIRTWQAKWLLRPAIAVAAALVLIACAQTVNAHYGQYPTVRTALGVAPSYQVPFSEIPRNEPTVSGVPLASVWDPARSTKPLPAQGAIAQVRIPGAVSGFPARPGMVYLPPAYFASPRPLLPVLVLVAGQPGNPEDWLNGGDLANRMNRYAAAHGGLAPVVIMPDNLGSPENNPMCIDSQLGNAATYLQVDVPNWVRDNLQVEMDPRAWAFGGLSNGGTCAVQMAVTAPERYPTFLDFSGEDEPRTGSREQTIADAFGGDTAAFTRINPLDILANRHFPGTAGVIVVGADDDEFRPQSERMYQACLAAGMDVQFSTLPGGHSWQVWGPALENSLPWLGSRLGITA